MQKTGIIEKKVERDGKTFYPFVMTTNDIDRDNEIIDIATMNIDNFVKNPVVYYQHQSWTAPIGTWENINKSNDMISGEASFHSLPDIETGAEISALVEEYVNEGILKTCSVGFSSGSQELLPIVDEKYIRMPDGSIREIPKEKIQTVQQRGGVTLLKDCELYECSIVSIPANPKAEAKIKKLEKMIKKIHTPERMPFQTHKEVEEEKVGRTISESNLNKLKTIGNTLNTLVETTQSIINEINDMINTDVEDDTEPTNTKEIEELRAEVKELKETTNALNNDILNLLEEKKIVNPELPIPEKWNLEKLRTLVKE